MEQGYQVEVTDRDGWRKTFVLEKYLIHVGSDSHNDIVLELSRGHGVAARHLQLFRVPGQPCRVINLGDAPIFYGPDRKDVLEPRQTFSISEGTTLTVGEYTLTFHGMAEIETDTHVRDSQAIGLELTLAQTRLIPETTIEGVLTVRNLGDKPGVQFLLAVEGLPAQCYTIGPGPLLFPAASKAVPFRLRHSQSPYPPAGKHELRVIATAPDAYPGEKAVIARTVEVSPYGAHTLRLLELD